MRCSLLFAMIADSSIHQIPNNFYLNSQLNPLLEAQTSFRASPPKKSFFQPQPLLPCLAPCTNAHYQSTSYTMYAIGAATKSAGSWCAQRKNSLVPLDLVRSSPRPDTSDEMASNDAKATPNKKKKRPALLGFLQLECCR